MNASERIEATDEEKAAAFDWLRTLALELPYAREARLAAIALQEWHDAKAGAEARIRALRLELGDVLVYQTDEQLEDHEREFCIKYLQREFPGVRILIVDAGAELQVFRPPEVIPALAEERLAAQRETERKS